jgi:hypothetical protein
VARARETRLARLTAAAVRNESADTLNRSGQRAWLAVCAVVREGLAQAGIDPARVKALRQSEAVELRCAEAAPHSNPLPGDGVREQVEEFTASDHDSLAGIFAAKIGDVAQRYQDEREPDFANASLAELFAWCLARPHPNPAPPAGGGNGGPRVPAIGSA